MLVNKVHYTTVQQVMQHVDDYDGAVVRNALRSVAIDFLPDHLSRIYDLIWRHGWVTSRMVCDTFDIERAAAAKDLKLLMDLGLLRRDKIEPARSRFHYAYYAIWD